MLGALRETYESLTERNYNVRRLLIPLATIFALALTAQRGLAQTTTPTVPTQERSAVSRSVNNDVSPPLRSLQPAQPVHQLTGVRPLRLIPRPQSVGQTAAVQSSQSPSSLIPALSLDFDGVGNGFSGPTGTFTVDSAPSDANGAVGLNHFFETVNRDFAICDKSGSAVLGPVPINILWAGFGGGCQSNNDGGATVAYDRSADRWVISQVSVSTTPYLQCVAVSQTGDPIGGYNRYSFQYTDFPDYPKLGVWPDAYYTTFNMFTGGTTFSGGQVCAYDRTRMLAGQAATQQCFSVGASFGGLLPSDLDGERQPPTGSPDYVLALGASANQLALWKFHVDWNTPANSTLVGPTTLAAAAFTEACGGGTCIPQSGTSQQLDSRADRLMYRLAYRNFGDHEALVVNHSVTAGSSVGIRWYEIRTPASTPTIFQQGTYAPDSNFRWMGSIAMDSAGDMALGFSLSGSSLQPEIHYTGRLAGDALGTLPQGEGTIIDGAGSQTNLSRWGGYSSMSIDPTDDCTFWYTNQYIPSNGSFNWKTRIGSFKFAGCGGSVTNDFSITATPSTVTVTAGGSGTSAISTAVTSGSAQSVNLSASGLPSGASASFNPPSITAGNSSTLSLNSGTAAAGTYPLIINGTGTSGTHPTTVTFVINPVVGNNFSISVSPSSVAVIQGGNGTSTISTAVTSGSAQSVSLSASGLPSGTSASFNPPSVTSGGSSVLTVTSSGTATTGTSNVTVRGTAPSGTHSASLSVTVTPSGGGGGGIINGGFETGTLSGWTSAGTTAVVSGGSHSGTYSARVGGTTPTNGDSSISQTFTAPSGSTSLNFWYQVHCPDTLTYDWATATLSDNTAGTTSTVVPKTCNNTAAWTQASASVSAGHSYTLTLISHDDNYASDPTYTLYDDVTLVTSSPPTNDFTISASPISLTLIQGRSGTSTISTAVTAGSAATVSLAASGMPTGATASLNATSVTAGGSSTLTVSVGAGVVAGNYTVTVTGTEGSKTHSATVSVTVTAPVPGGIINGGFETGAFSGWTTSGASTSITTASHSGTFAALAGSTSPTNGDSSISQTFTAPSGTNTLSFWYKTTCPDSVTYDWVTATLTDNTIAIMITLLPQICATTAWTQVVGASITPGHSYTLTLINHDDNYANPPDPTYTLFDDLTLQ